MDKFTGEAAALLTAVFWTTTALAFEYAGRKVGSLVVNIIRLCFAFLLLGTYNFIVSGLFIPVNAGTHQWFWLSLSGLVGFVIGDLLLFRSYLINTSRISMLIMTTVPPVTAIISVFALNERMSLSNVLAMMITITGIGIAILSKSDKNNGKFGLGIPIKGLLYALGGALGQAGGLVLSKYGMQEYDPFLSTQIRIITGVVGFSLIITLMKKWKNVGNAFKNRQAITGISIGSVFGPFLGVSFSLLAIQHTKTGIAATLMALVPILIILPSRVIFKQKISAREVVGAIISVIGVALFFIK